MIANRRSCRRAVAISLSVLGLALLSAALQATEPDANSLKTLKVLFKFDPGPTYGGVRWVSPRTFNTGLQGGTEVTVEAKVEGLDGNSRRVAISPTWTAADPAMVVVSPLPPSVGDHVQIAVKHAGECKLTVAALGVSKELLIKATWVANGKATHVEVSQ